MPKIIANICMHYGSDYAAYAIQAIYDQVDKILVVYADRPSHGHASCLVNPDNKAACRQAIFANGDPRNKIEWVEGNWGQEGAQRNVVLELYPKAELIAVVDADEIWHPQEFAAVQEWCRKQPVWSCKQKLRTPWRSFDWICDDPMMPDRFIRPGQPMGTYAYVPTEIGVYYHMGYAREPRHIEYKLSCHGHKNELITGWFQDKFLAWSPTNNIPDLHPTCTGFWYAQPFDKRQLPAVLRAHPYWDKAFIE